jgi:hypothetical protein
VALDGLGLSHHPQKRNPGRMDIADFNLVSVHKYSSQEPYQVQRSAKKCLKASRGHSSPQFLRN